MRSSIIRLISFFIFLFSFLFLKGQSYYIEYDHLSDSIYSEILDLKLNSARQNLTQLKSLQPYNLVYIHLENYIDFFELFISEDKSRFRILEKNKNGRIKDINRLLKDSDPFKRFVKAEIILQWALTRAKFGHIFKSGREIYAAYSLLEKNQELFPKFIYNNKSLSIIHALIETISIPGFVKTLMGMKGSITQGISEIKAVLDYSKIQSFFFQKEAEAIYTYILFYQCNKKTEAFEFLQSSSLDHNKSLLANFLKSKIAQRAGHNDLAMLWLQNRPQGEEYANFYYLEFMEGMCKLRNLDRACFNHFKNFINNFHGQHYLKEAYQKLAWAHLVFNEDHSAYSYYMQFVKKYGQDQLDADKQALKESKLGISPNPVLLKSRLLFDGGYYQKSMSLLLQNKSLFAKKHQLLLEYLYRMGRLSHAMDKHTEAIYYYEKTIKSGKDKSSYFACNSALQLGLIYEEKMNHEDAVKYFRECLAINPDEYKTSLHQKAKSGIERLIK